MFLYCLLLRQFCFAFLSPSSVACSHTSDSRQSSNICLSLAWQHVFSCNDLACAARHLKFLTIGLGNNNETVWYSLQCYCVQMLFVRRPRVYCYGGRRVSGIPNAPYLKLSASLTWDMANSGESHESSLIGSLFIGDINVCYILCIICLLCALFSVS